MVSINAIAQESPRWRSVEPSKAESDKTKIIMDIENRIISHEKTAVIYERVSSTGDRQTTERQVADLLSFAKREGYRVVNTFEEKCSGAVPSEEQFLSPLKNGIPVV